MIGSSCTPSPVMKGRGSHIGVAQRHRRGFRAPARCRSEDPALHASLVRVSRSRAMPVGDRRSTRRRRWFRAPARCRSETGAPRVVGAGFALPRDAGRRTGAPRAIGSLRGTCREGSHFERGRRGFRAPAVPVGDRRSRAMPVGGPHRESWPRSTRHRVLEGDVSRGALERGRRCGFRAPARCRSETGAPRVVGAGFALPRDAGRRPALHGSSVRVSRSRAMPVGDRRSTRHRVLEGSYALPRDAGEPFPRLGSLPSAALRLWRAA